MTFDVADELIHTIQTTVNIQIKLGAIQGLGELGDAKSLEALRATLKSSTNVELRAAAAKALGRAGYLYRN